MVTYGLVDGANEYITRPDPPRPPRCGQGEARPNLVPNSWSARYNAQPGGTGALQYRVSNTGRATAPAGVNVNLILSTDRIADSSDHWVTWEEIPFELRPGFSAVRDADNPLSFRFHDLTPAGRYHMALWVDDVNEVRECDETDNVSLGRDRAEFRVNLPDIAVESWWVRWGIGVEPRYGHLHYRIVNKGTTSIASTDWEIVLVLHSAENANDRSGTTYFLFYEDAGDALFPNGAIVRDFQNPGRFDLYKDQFGNYVEFGVYYMSLWVDPVDQVRESSEWNNLSRGINRVAVGSRGRSTSKQSTDFGNLVDQETSLGVQEFVSTFNGKVLPEPLWRKVEIVEGADGSRELIFLDEKFQPEQMSKTGREPKSQMAEDTTVFEKSNRSSDIVIFPVAGELRMP